MPAPLLRDLRERIIQAVEGGSSMRGAAARFAVTIQAELRRERGIAVCLATIHVSLRRLGLRHNKRA